FSSMLRRPPISPSFPYTTLFRSGSTSEAQRGSSAPMGKRPNSLRVAAEASLFWRGDSRLLLAVWTGSVADRSNFRVSFLPVFLRSEEHTSELQSRENLVCRLLLE